MKINDYTKKNGLYDTQNNDLWNTYSNQIKQSSINQKAELAAINEKANSYVNAYMKSLGLEGTSAGANAIADNSMNLMNAYSQVNANEQQAQNALNQDNLNRFENLLETGIAYGKNYDELNQLINDSNISPEDKTYYSQLLEQSGITWQAQRDTELENLENSTGNLTGDDKAYATNIISELRNAKTLDEYNAIRNKYQSVLNDSSTIVKSEGSKKYADSNIITNIQNNNDYQEVDAFNTGNGMSKSKIRDTQWNNGGFSNTEKSEEYKTLKNTIENKYGSIENGKAYYLNGTYYRFDWNWFDGYHVTAYRKK